MRRPFNMTFRSSREPTSRSEQWGQTLPPTNLRELLVYMHALVLLLDAKSTANNKAEIEAAEHVLRSIAVYTKPHPREYARPPQSETFNPGEMDCG